MDHASSSIPAWKRLGLKLKKGDQSGDTVPDLDSTQNIEHPPHVAGSGLRGSDNDDYNNAGPTENGKRPLGKRKHHESPAEDHDQTPKKIKLSDEQKDPNGAAVNVAAPTAQQVETKPLSNESPTAGNPRPKGDPNYRKKQKGRRISGPTEEVAALKFHQDDGQPMTANQKKVEPESQSQTRYKPSRTQSPLPSETSIIDNGSTLLASTESDFAHSHSVATPETANKLGKPSQSTALNSSPVRADRRKSVTFTPDTKTGDGNSASNFFKKWVAELKAGNTDFSQAEAAQFTPPPKVHPANGIGPTPSASETQTLKSKKKDRQKKEKQDTTKSASSEPTESRTTTAETGFKPAPSKGKKKDPSIYLSYLSQYHNDRTNWKFNKAKQNDVLDNALNVFRIPDEYLEALLEYTKGLQGAGVIERLKQRCQSTLEELDKAEKEDSSTNADVMDDQVDRKGAKAEAFEERLAKEKKRRRTDADVEGLASHPYPDGYIRRLKRHRADALRKALGVAVAAAPAPAKLTNGSVKSASAMMSGSTAVQRSSRNRKSRTEVSSDESSSSSDESSNSEDSDSESSEEESDSDSESGSDSGSNNSGSDDERSSDEDSSSGSGSDSGDESRSESDHDSEDDGLDNGSDESD